jgi:signal transduction histidine kinase/ligand-binding sensor domain-containing protein/CheY-like chemotaxis protein
MTKANTSARLWCRLPVLVFLLAGRPLEALDPATAITQYHHESWGTEQGLPQNTVPAIVRSRDGYLWFGTELGLVRFDGLKFEVFDRKNTPALKSNVVTTLAEDRWGALWIGTMGGGLTRLVKGVFTTFTTHEGLAGDTVLSLHEDRAGALWIGTGGGLSRWWNGGFTSGLAKDGLASDAVYAIAEDSEGNLWAGTHRGLSRLRGGAFHNYRIADGLPNEYIRCLQAARGGGLWIGTNGGGLVRFRDGRFRVYTVRDGLPADAVFSIWEQPDGTLWVGTLGGGLGRLAGGTFTTWKEKKDGSPNVDVWSLYGEDGGALWMGTGGSGLHRFSDPRLTPYGRPEGLSDDVVLPVFEDREGGIWTGTNGRGVNRLFHGSVRTLTTGQGLADNVVFSIAQDLGGAMWFATRKGVNRMENGRLRLYTTKDGLASDIALSMRLDREGTLWIGTREGLSSFRRGVFHTYTTRDGLSSNVIQAIEEGRDGSLWIGTGGGGVDRFKDGRFEVFDTRRGLSNDLVFSVYPDPDGVVWVGTNGGGLNRLKNGTIHAYTTRDGLPDDAVFKILDDGAGYLWMSSDLGIFRIARQELGDVAEGKIHLLSPVLYGRKDGMRSRECNGGIQPAGWKTRDGRLWFPTMGGAVMVDPARLRQPQPAPRVFLEQVEINRKPFDAREEWVRARPGPGELEFRYGAIDFQDAAHTGFKYRLEGFDPEWIDAGTRREAYYTNIPPGSYRFRVIARNGAGAWDRAGASFRFELEPHFYQTGWFEALALLGLAGCAAGAPVLRVRQLRARARLLSRHVAERTAELHRETAERERAERDLLKAKEAEQANRIRTEFLANISHEIRTPMNGILGMAELGLGTDPPQPQRECFTSIRDCATTLLSVINDILDFSKIQAGKQELDRIDFDLQKSLGESRQMIAFRAREKGLEMSCEIHPEVPAAIQGDPNRLRQILLNLLGNAVKFTERGTVGIRVALESRQGSELLLHFTVQDTGIGIPREKQAAIFDAFSQADRSINKKYGGTGLGLTIAARLVELMGGKIWVDSEPGCGSQFHFTARFGVANGNPDPPPRPAAARPPVRPLRILLAEDNPVNQKVAVALLRKYGHTVSVAGNGTEALAALEREPFDVVLMDVQMPGMDGFEATARIREAEQTSGAHLPIIALTAHAVKGFEERCLESGMDGYVSKPLRIERLCDAMEALTQGSGRPAAFR